jgi:PAS domain S-box-containing protein
MPQDLTVYLPPGGRMGELIRSMDWSKTPLGPMEQWPQTLLSNLTTILESPFPLLICWGRELTILYNDAYINVLSTKHVALGKNLLDVWPEARDFIEPLIEKAFAGESVLIENAPFTLTRVGYPEQAWFDFSFSPLRDREGSVAGLLNTTFETTKREEVLLQSEQRYRTLFESIDEGFCIIKMLFDERGNPVDYQFIETNPAFESQSGIENSTGKRMRDIAPTHEEHWFEIYGQVAKTGESVRVQYPAKALGRFFDVNAFRVGNPDQHLVGILFRDITERKNSEEALRESEARYCTLFERTANPILVIDNKGNYIDGNKAALRFLECSRDELLGMNVVDTIPTGKEKMLEEHLPLWETGGILETEYFVKGRVKNMILTITPGMWLGRPVVYGNGTDITERKRAEEAVRESEERFRSTFAQAAVGMAHLTPKGSFLRVNQKFCRILGYTSDELLQLTVQEISHPDDLNNDLALGEKLIKGLISTYSMEKRYLHKDGTYIWTNLTGSLVRNGAGEPEYFIGVIEDITERKRDEEELRKSEARYRELVQNANSAIIRWKADGTMTFFNEYAQNFFGYSADEVIGKHVGMLVPQQESTGADLSDLVREIMANPEQYVNYVNENVRKDGSRAWMTWTNKPIFNDQGKVAEILAVGNDITERKRAEAEREKLQAQLTQAQKMEAVGQLAGGVAHDFNNMLNVINGYAELLLNDLPPDSPYGPRLQEILKAGRQSADIVRQLLAFARKQTIDPQVLDLNEIMGDMLKMLRNLIGENIDLAWMPEHDLWQVKMDPVQLNQMLANLAINGRDAIADVGRLTIETANVVLDQEYCSMHQGFIPGEYVLVAVSDDGVGMDAKTQSQLFEPFFTTKEPGKGTGLGLATVYGIVKQNRGFINVYSEPGEGTTFRVYLPRYQSAPAEERPSSTLDEIPSGGETVLLVEDKPVVLDLCTAMLEDLGYEVLPAADQKEALRLAREHLGEIHLLLTDVIMPEMNGRDLRDQILPLRPGIKCLFMSGYTANVIAHHGILEEGINFIEKPFSRHPLAVKLRQVITGA